MRTFGATFALVIRPHSPGDTSAPAVNEWIKKFLNFRRKKKINSIFVKKIIDLSGQWRPSAVRLWRWDYSFFFVWFPCPSVRIMFSHLPAVCFIFLNNFLKTKMLVKSNNFFLFCFVLFLCFLIASAWPGQCLDVCR